MKHLQGYAVTPRPDLFCRRRNPVHRIRLFRKECLSQEQQSVKELCRHPAHHPANTVHPLFFGGSGIKLLIKVSRKHLHPVDGIPVQLQFPENPFCHVRPGLTEKCSPAENLVLRKSCCPAKPLPKKLRHLFRALRSEYAVKALGNIGRHAGLFHHQHLFRMFRKKGLGQFHLDAFSAHVNQVRRDVGKGLPGLILDGKIQLGRKTDGPENPEGILRKPLLCRPHAADHPVLQILYALKGIHHARLLRVGHGVDGKVPAPQILEEAFGECHLRRMAAVQIGPVNPVGGYFIADMVHQNGHGTVLNSGIDGPFKDLFYLLRFRRGGDIPVSGRAAKQGIPHTAADGEGFMPRLPELSYDIRDVRRHIHTDIPALVCPVSFSPCHSP